jgi:hypothetical protein
MVRYGSDDLDVLGGRLLPQELDRGLHGNTDFFAELLRRPRAPRPGSRAMHMTEYAAASRMSRSGPSCHGGIKRVRKH